MNFSRFEMRIDFAVDSNQLLVALEIVDAFAKCAVAHEEILTTDTQRTRSKHEQKQENDFRIEYWLIHFHFEFYYLLRVLRVLRVAVVIKLAADSALQANAFLTVVGEQ